MLQTNLYFPGASEKNHKKYKTQITHAQTCIFIYRFPFEIYTELYAIFAL